MTTNDSEPFGARYFSWFLFGLCLVSVFAVFGFILPTHGFVYDDHYLILQNPYLADWKNAVLFFTHDVTEMSGVHAASGYYRPLSMVLLQVLFHLFGAEAWKYHAFNLGIHALNCFLGGILLLRLGASRNMVLLSTLLFAVHPVHAEAVVLVCDYMGLLSAFCALLALLSFEKGRRSGILHWMILACFLYAAGIFFKEDILPLPLVLGLTDYLFLTRDRKKIFRTCADLIPFAAIALVYLGLRGVFVEKGAAFGFWQNTASVNIVTPGGIAGWLGSLFLVFKSYFWIWVWPSPLTIYHVIRLPDTLTAWALFAAQCVLIGWLLVRLSGPNLAKWALSWFFLFSLLICNLIPIGGLFAERLIYLPSYGLAVLTAVSIENFFKSRPIAWQRSAVGVLVAGWLALIAMQSANYAKNWVSDYAVWSHARQLEPARPYPDSQLANVFYDQGDYHSAAKYYLEAAELARTGELSFVSRMRAAEALGRAREYDAALLQYRRILLLYPKSWMVWFQMGWTYFLKGDWDAASKVYRAILSRNPDHGWSYYGLAEIAFKRGNSAAGRQLYADALNHSSDKALMVVILKNLKNRS